MALFGEQCRGTIRVYLGVCFFVFIVFICLFYSYCFIDTGLLGHDQHQLKKEKTEEPTFLYNECSYWLSRSIYSLRYQRRTCHYYCGTWQRCVHVWKPLQSFTVKLKFKFKSLMHTTPCWSPWNDWLQNEKFVDRSKAYKSTLPKAWQIADITFKMLVE